MVDVVPGFIYRQIPCNYSAEHWDWSWGLVLHVATGPADASLYGWFSNPAASASSHWWAGASGGAEQYLDPIEHQGWAQADGNASYHSVETGGDPDAPLTEAQCQAVARIYRWGHDRFGWPYQLAEVPGQKGLAWHGMGGSAWGGHTSCPGELRKAQRQHILDLAQGSSPTTGDDMPTPQDLWNAVLPGGNGFTAAQVLVGTNTAAWAASGKLDKLNSDTLATALASKLAPQLKEGLDPKTIADEVVKDLIGAVIK